MAVPVFDRSIEIARAGGRLIPRKNRHHRLRGQLSPDAQLPGTAEACLFDFTVLVEVDEAELRRRLTSALGGYGLDEEGIRRKLDTNGHSER